MTKLRVAVVVLAMASVSTAAMAAKRRAVRSGSAPAPQTQTITLTPSRDNTLFESNTGAASNGAGVHIFTGTTQGSSRRRALLLFDIAGAVPAGSKINRVVLTLRVSTTISGAQPVTLHRVTSDWGQGTSNAGLSRDGNGAPSAANDATWIHTFSPNTRWITPGGDFDSAPDATAQVATTTGIWESAAMVTRVQQWLDTPSSNRGWIVIGNETRGGTAKRFDSREIATASARPSLLIEYQN